MSRSLYVKFLLLGTLLLGSAFFNLERADSAETIINATVRISLCGNGLQEGYEQCDSEDMNQRTCATFGLSGTLRCSNACEYETSSCTSSSSGGGGGGVVVPTPIPNPMGVSVTPTSSGQALKPSIADINGDKKVNLIDFSVLAYWWGKSVQVNAPYDLNKDGKVTLIDFSILAYYWTIR